MRVTEEQREAWRKNTAESPFNTWLNGQVKGASGTLELAKLHALARRYGIDREAEYAHLNPGQQRMNIGNILRRIVPEAEYGAPPKAALSLVEPPSAKASGRQTVRATPPSSERPHLITSAPVRDLLRMHGQIMDELRARDVVRTSNSPVGDYAELLFSRAFGWDLAANSVSGHDAVDSAGVRYQIKSRRLTSLNGSRQLSALRRLPDKHFDYLAAVLFNSEYDVFRAAIIPHECLERRCRYSDHVKAWIFLLDDAVWSLPEVRDVTNELSAAASQI